MNADQGNLFDAKAQRRFIDMRFAGHWSLVTGHRF